MSHTLFSIVLLFIRSLHSTYELFINMNYSMEEVRNWSTFNHELSVVYNTKHRSCKSRMNYVDGNQWTKPGRGRKERWSFWSQSKRICRIARVSTLLSSRLQLIYFMSIRYTIDWFLPCNGRTNVGLNSHKSFVILVDWFHIPLTFRTQK